MAWIRQEPSGNWAATVYTPLGRRRETFRLKGQAEAWARDQERDIADQAWIDPKAGKTTVGELWDRFHHSRRLEAASIARDRSHWNVHVEPRWARLPIGPILKPDIDGWVVEMETAGHGAATIQGAVGVLRALLGLAVDARLIRFNPAAQVKATRRDAHLDRVLDEDEDELLLANLDARFPGQSRARLFTEVLLYCGLRYEENAALDRDRIDMRRRLIHVGPVMEKSGRIRPYPKSPAGVRSAAIDDDLWPRLRDHVLTVAPGGLIWSAPRGGPLLYDHWRDQVWLKGLREVRPMSDAEIEAWKAARRTEGRRPWKAGWTIAEPILDDPQPTPHDLRHTYGTRLAEGGVPPHEIMALMGHADLRSVQRYLHAREGRFDRAREAMRRVRRPSS